MIRYLQNKEIDYLKWDQRVIESRNSRMYALAGYLDAVCSSWDAVVFDDYKAILPLPVNRRLIVRRSLMPPFVQQLGVIGTDDHSLMNEMLNLPLKKFWSFQHQLNHENGKVLIKGLSYDWRTNFEIYLGPPYQKIMKSYDKHLMRNLNKTKSAEMVLIESNNFDKLQKFIMEYSPTGDRTKKHLKKVRNIFEYKTELFQPTIYEIQQNTNTIAVAMIPRFLNRMTLLIPRSNPEGRTANALAFLIDQVIQQHSNSEMIFDFEGSMIPGVARFYKQFGAIDKPYLNIFK